MRYLVVPVVLFMVVRVDAGAQSRPDTTTTTSTSAPGAADTASAQSAKVYFDFQVDVPAKRLDNAYARYPNELVPQPGCVLVRVLVDSTGRVALETLKVLNSTDSLFTKEVLKIMPRVKYLAAQLRGRNVSQWADLRFSWSAGSTPSSAPVIVCR
jgi:outer membrane biosynthesis protein TonB